MPDCPFPERYTSQSAFNVRYRRGGLTATGMLIYTYIKENAGIGTPRDDFSRAAPSLSVSLQPWQDEMLFLRLMYKSTFRTPTFNDLYYYQMGNKNLAPERANEYNAGITWSRPLAPWMDYFSLTVDGYYNDVTDKIVAFPTTYAWKMVNYGKVHTAGIDASLAASFTLARQWRMSLSAAYTWQKAVDLTNPDAKNYKDQLPYTPVHSGNAAASLDMPWGSTLGYSVLGVGQRYYKSQNIPDNLIDGYMEHTLSLSHTFGLKRGKLQLQGEVHNLTDEQYDVIKYYPMPGRSYRFSLTWMI